MLSTVISHARFGVMLWLVVVSIAANALSASAQDKVDISAIVSLSSSRESDQLSQRIENPFVMLPAADGLQEPTLASPQPEPALETTPRFRVTVRPAELIAPADSGRATASELEGIIQGDVEYESSPIPDSDGNTAVDPPQETFGLLPWPPSSPKAGESQNKIPSVDVWSPTTIISPRRSAEPTAQVKRPELRLANIPGEFHGQDSSANTDSATSGGTAATNTNTSPVVEHPTFGYANCYENACYDSQAFVPNPNYACQTFNPDVELGVYRGKFCVPAQAPWVELGRGLYRPGPLPPAATFLTGETNPIIPHFLIYGDYRTAVAFNDNGNGNGDEATIWGNRLNLDFDLKITSTERIHAFWGPLDRGGQFTRAEFRDHNGELIPELDNNLDTLYFEGDLGYMWGGMTDRWAPFDLPLAAGRYPLLFQNGTWMVDAIDGFAFTFPGKNSPFLDWSNYDITFFFGFSDVDSPAFTDDSQADLYGVQSFIEAYDGYLEMGYAFLNDRSGQGFSYHNVGLSYSRRFLHRVSTSFRAILNCGQDPVTGDQSADGQVFLWENAFVTRAPNYFVPYVNAFVGFDRPQSVARAAGTGGLLVNTGINFESDGLTNYPTLDATANNTWGGACGINLLGPDFSWQLITELAMVQTFRQGGFRTALGDQYAFGARFQMPLNNAWLLHVDGMYGLREGDDDIRGARTELRWKF